MDLELELELESGLKIYFTPDFKVPSLEEEEEEKKKKEEYIPYRYRYSLKGKKKLTRGIRKDV